MTFFCNPRAKVRFFGLRTWTLGVKLATFPFCTNSAAHGREWWVLQKLLGPSRASAVSHSNVNANKSELCMAHLGTKSEHSAGFSLCGRKHEANCGGLCRPGGPAATAAASANVALSHRPAPLLCRRRHALTNLSPVDGAIAFAPIVWPCCELVPGV